MSVQRSAESRDMENGVCSSGGLQNLCVTWPGRAHGLAALSTGFDLFRSNVGVP
jgi:hypothetical protein